MTSDVLKVKNTEVRLMRGDITTLDIECFVFYAQPSLKLGSGFGTAIAVRGGRTIQEELNTLGEQHVTDVVTTQAGELGARLIIHAVGPAFQEPDMEIKLHTTVVNILHEADRQKVSRLALPALGAGFYGIPLPVCADVMLSALQEYLSTGQTGLKEVIICVLDNRELKPFRDRLGQPIAV